MYSTTRTRLALSAGALLITAFIAACGTGGTGGPAPAPSDPPAPVPSEVADPTAVPAPNLRIDLDSTSGQQVTVDILDRSRSVTGARSGEVTEGVSFPSDDIVIENVDARTLRLGWSDYPIDNELQLYIDPVGVGYRLVLIQPAPSGPADAMGEDRILELTFDRDISAAEVDAFLQDGLDVPG